MLFFHTCIAFHKNSEVKQRIHFMRPNVFLLCSKKTPPKGNLSINISLMASKQVHISVEGPTRQQAEYPHAYITIQCWNWMLGCFLFNLFLQTEDLLAAIYVKVSLSMQPKFSTIYTHKIPIMTLLWKALSLIPADMLI